MNIVVFSDVHLHPFEPFSSLDPSSGLNTRLLDGINAIKQVKDYCIKKDIKLVLNCGDLVHKCSNGVGIDLLELTIRELVDFQKHDIRIVSIVGQHDFLKKDGFYNFPKSLAALMAVLHEPGEFVDLDGLRITGCSYRYDLEIMKAALKEIKPKKGVKNILLGHFLLKELLEQNAAPFDNSEYIGLADLPRMDYTFLGDYHFHVQLKGKNVVSVGGLLQHTFGSKNRGLGGFLDFDLDQMTFKRIEIDAPMFVEIKAGEKIIHDEISPKNFYKIYVNDKQEEDKIRVNMDGYKVVFEPVVNDDEEIDQEARMEIGIDMSPEKVVATFCEYFEKDKEYLERGLSYL